MAGRVNIKMTAHKIAKNDDDNNDNGINWVEEYVQNNMNSLIGGSFKVSFIDEERTIPSGHGKICYDDKGNIYFENSTVVGSILKVEIEDLQLNGEKTKALVAYGYLYEQDYPNFVNWLKNKKNSETIYGSVEINPKGRNNQRIEYDGKYINDDGTLYFGRKPKVYDYTSVAILSSFVPPADHKSQIVELNENMKKENVLNALEVEQLRCNLERKVEKYLGIGEGVPDKWGYVLKVYPYDYVGIYVIHSENADVYQKFTYKIVQPNDDITIENIEEVEPSWKLKDKTEFETSQSIIKNMRLKFEEKQKEVTMTDNKKIAELNAVIEEKTAEIDVLNKKLAEVNESLVSANKAYEGEKAEKELLLGKISEIEIELNSFKEKEEQARVEQLKAEVSSYYETDIKVGGYSEAELNSFKKLVEANDMEGIKKLESELITKKFKESLKKEPGAEINAFSFVNFPDVQHKTLEQKIDENNFSLFE